MRIAELFMSEASGFPEVRPPEVRPPEVRPPEARPLWVLVRTTPSGCARAPPYSTTGRCACQARGRAFSWCAASAGEAERYKLRNVAEMV